ncbi:hypothetical protein E1281_01160 [Actinomadura sp. KC345]|nr:hypothetical protein E1281_01160 [Actinomadura sp. KC345]
MNASDRAWRAINSAKGRARGWASSTWTATLNAANRVWSALQSAQAAGARWAGRVFTATFNVIRRGFPGFAKGGVIGAASGGPRSNTVLVGEQGPELVSLPGGSTVHTNGDSKRMLAAGGGGGPAEVLLRIEAGNSDLDKLLVQVLRKAIKNQHGGNVQVALGGRP